MSFPTTHPQRSAPALTWRILEPQSIALAVIIALCFVPLFVRDFTKSKNSSKQIALNQPVELARLSENVSVRAYGRGNPLISLSDGRELLTAYVGQEELRVALERNRAQPLSLASADFDEDGVPDLVSGYGYEGGGIVTLLRGNVDSIYPNAPEAQSRRIMGTFTDAPFLSPARVFESPIPGDFISAGDFDGDGHWDVVLASRQSSRLCLLSGDGKGELLLTREIDLPGMVTAFTAGEINRRDGLTDVVVGVEGSEGPKVLVFEWPKGALASTPESIDVAARVNSLALGFLDGHYAADLAIGSGQELMIVSGRDRKLSMPRGYQVTVEPGKIERFTFDSVVRSIAIGDFASDERPDIGVLTADGSVQVLVGLPQSGSLDRTSKNEPSWSPALLSRKVSASAFQLLTAAVSSLPKDESSS